MKNDIFSKLLPHIRLSKVGIEKESLRVKGKTIDNSAHPFQLGSALCNNFITTDFSEAQLEFITPPFNTKLNNLSFLEDIHHYVTHNIGGSILWPMSIPPYINDEEELPIAEYGSSNLGTFKRVYRNGLSNRYGRVMQAISGTHFNYSIANSFWEEQLEASSMEGKLDARKSSLYFNMLRNISRLNWIILYLFGCSPVLTKNYIPKNSRAFTKMDKATYYLPYATSLRMSKYGYRNLNREHLSVSLNTLSEYTNDLRMATLEKSKDYVGLFNKDNSLDCQINENILQIEDEYYAIARVKSDSNEFIPNSTKLLNQGIDFIEFRSLDLNPFSRIGIDEETFLFIEVFLLHCFIKQERNFTQEDLDAIKHNDALVAEEGRRPDIKIIVDGEKKEMKDYGKRIIDEMMPIANALDNSDDHNYTDAVEKMRQRISNPSLTLSGRFIDEMLSSRRSFIEHGLKIANSNRQHYLNIKETENKNWDLLKVESHKSKMMQSNL